MAKNAAKKIEIPAAAKGRWGVDKGVNHRPVRFVNRKREQDRKACRGRYAGE